MAIITPDRFIALKDAVRNEIKRRSKTDSGGKISATYYSSTYDYTTTPASGKIIAKEYLTKNGTPLSKINSSVIPDPANTSGRIITGVTEYSPTTSNTNPSTVTGDISKMEAAVSYWSKKSVTATSTSATGCLSSCTGLCYTNCYTDCSGGCSGDCDGSCYGDCDGGCSGNCGSTCTGMCWDGAL